MGIGVGAPAVSDRSFLVEFGFGCVDLLVLDDHWTIAAGSRDPAAIEIGHHMQTLLARLREQRPRLTRLVLASRLDLNAAWPHALDRWNLGTEQKAMLDSLVAPYGGFGEAGVAAVEMLDECLAEEIASMEAKLAEIETGGPSPADLKWRSRKVLALVAICAFCIPAIAVAGVALGAVTVGVAVFEAALAEAAIAASILLAAIAADGSSLRPIAA